MNKYESMYVLKPDLDEETRKSLIEKFKSLVEENGGKVEKVDEWGQRKLAYEINYIKEGYYVLMTFESGPEFPLELERNYNINDSVLRFNVIRL
ncbi:MAG: 30S ribosomal protein S6 [Eubacteriales bacterium]|nr:30S ribosomal protein S6 [Eubacteriales bacterium]